MDVISASGRRPHVLIEKQDGTLRAARVGKADRSGTPVRRGHEALDDLNNRGGIPTDFVPYIRP